MKEYAKEYTELIMKHPERYAEDVEKFFEKVNQSGAIYHGEVVKTVMQGIFYDDKDEACFKKIGKIMMSIGRKVTDAYVTDEDYRKLFGFPEFLETLILKNPGYPCPVPMARYDIFYDDPEHFKFCELNTDGSSAMNEDNTFGKIFLETKALKDFVKDCEAINYNLIDSWVEKTLSLYHSLHGEKKPNVAIVDFLESGTTEEFKVFQEAYTRAGVKAVIADAGDLDFDGEYLRYQDLPIDLVYRRLVTGEMMQNLNRAKALCDAYLQDKVLLIGGFRSQLMHTKEIFSILRHEKSQALLTEEENRFLEKHLPKTEPFCEEKMEQYLQEKEELVFKPKDGYGGDGVFFGADYDENTLRKKLSRMPEGMLVQERVILPVIPVVDWKNSKFSLDKMAYVTGLFYYFEEFQGVYTRADREGIIAADAYTLPHIHLRRRT